MPKLAAFISYNRIDNSYKDHYQVGFSVNGNNFRQGAVYIPVYSYREMDCAAEIAANFSITNDNAIETAEYFEFHDLHRLLRVYKYIDLVEYANQAQHSTEKPICDNEALLIAQNFLDVLPHRKPQSHAINRFDDEIIVNFTGVLSGLPNHAFPTTITLSPHGDVMSAIHYFFDYEILDTADIISVRTALATLPHQSDKIRLTNYSLVYDFADSVLMPFYRFEGYSHCGAPFVFEVSAICFN